MRKAASGHVLLVHCCVCAPSPVPRGACVSVESFSGRALPGLPRSPGPQGQRFPSFSEAVLCPETPRIGAGLTVPGRVPAVGTSEAELGEVSLRVTLACQMGVCLGGPVAGRFCWGVGLLPSGLICCICEMSLSGAVRDPGESRVVPVSGRGLPSWEAGSGLAGYRPG